MTDPSANDGGDATEDDGRTDAYRWSSRPELADEDDFTRGGGPSRPTPAEPQPTRNPERDWGFVLAVAGTLVVLLGAAIIFSVLMGGILGMLPVRSAVILTVLLLVTGGAGLVQGWRVYHGR